MKILLIITLLSHFIYVSLQLKQNLHVLQLNSYFNSRYLHWLQDKWFLDFFMPRFLPLLAIPLAFLYPQFSLFLYLFCVYVVLLFWRVKSGQKKKPLVFTSRALRLYTTSILLLSVVDSLILFVLWGTQVNFSSLLLNITILTILSCFSFFWLIFCNFLLIPLEKIITNYYLYDARKRLQAFANLKVIGITGSFGKTSTKYILNEILRHKYNILELPGSFNTPMGITKIIRSHLKSTHEIFVAELSAKKPGDIRELCKLVHPQFGLLTAIGEQHLETFKTLENIKKTKNEILECLPENGVAFLNMDNEHCRDLAKQTKQKCVYYGIDAEKLDYRASAIEIDARGSSFMVTKSDGTTEKFQTKLLGQHNVYNILAAIAVAAELGMTFKDMIYPIRQLKPVEHRLELRKIGPGAILLDDTFNSNPIGSKMALDVLAKIAGKRKIIITPGMIELGDKENLFNSQFGEYIAAVCDYVILVGKNKSLAIQEGLNKQNFPMQNCFIADNFQEAYQHLLSMLQKDDVVLFENDLPVDY